MSLIRQVWLLLLGTVLLAFAGSVGVSLVSARDTLETQLRLKNSDNAASLALALSQQKGDPELMGLLLTAQFDTGFYRSIRLVGADAKPVFVREANLAPAHAPQWFVALLPIESVPGLAQVSDGWRALGSVQVVSHTAFAHDELWQGGLWSAAALAVVGVLAALLASWVVSHIRKPLDDTVRQARSLVDGQFVTMPEPRAPELRRLTQAMNGMVARLKQTFEAQASQVEALRRQATCDPATGLSNRTHFMGQLNALLHREDGAAEGGLVLLRLIDLASINRALGHATTDRVIATVAQALEAYVARVAGCFVGRLNGADFALCLPVGGLSQETAQALAKALRALLPAFGKEAAIAAGAVEIRHGTPVAQLMGEADLALARAEAAGAFQIEFAGETGSALARLGEGGWRRKLHEALIDRRVQLAEYPVHDAAGRLLHLECPLRLQLDPDGPAEPAARWLPLALRSRLTAALDERAIALALAASAGDGLARAVNIAPASLAEGGFAGRVRVQLLAAPPAARLLWLEVPEVAAVESFDLVAEFGRQIRPAGARFGLEHAGEQLARIEGLFELGLDYVKLDAAVTHALAGDSVRSGFVLGIVAMLHSLSLQVVAEGVDNEADARALWQCGVDGQTGRWISRQREEPRLP